MNLSGFDNIGKNFKVIYKSNQELYMYTDVHKNAYIID